MTRLQYTARRISLGIGIAVITLAAFKHELAPLFDPIVGNAFGMHVNKYVSTAIFAVILSIVFACLEMWMRSSIDKSRRFRRALLGSKDIEDYWLDHVLGMNGQILHGEC